jgi:uncharacterized damage-inducible protein DinB
MNCAESSKVVLQQIQAILNQLSDDQYSRPLDVFNGSTLGQHFRHILDFYCAVLKAAGSGQLDYGDRARDKGVELYTSHALASFEQITKGILELSDDEQIEVITDFHTDTEAERPKVVSSIGRELMYAYDHAVHHLAIIKIGIKSHCPDVILNPHVGVAPSTIKFNATQHHP